MSQTSKRKPPRARAPSLTVQDRAEQEPRRVFRSLKLLSQLNQTLVRATREDDLLDATCRIIVREGGYRLAWVGYMEQDEQKSVRPVAQEGFEAGYLKTTHISWADNERGRGPTGTAIRTGRPSLMRHIFQDPAFAPWRAAAKQRGYASSISLPLLDQSTVFGALNIYATEPDAFDTGEVQLLTELAGDLAFGIMALRTRAERERDERERRRLNERLVNVFETMSDAFVSLDPEWRYTFVNTRAGELLQRRPQDLIGKHIWTEFPDGVGQKFYQAYYRAVETQTPQYLEDYFLAPERWVASRIYPSQDGLAVFFTDITERKRAETALRESESKFSKIFFSSPVPISISRLADGQYIDANDAFLKTMGYAREELIGKTALELNTWADPAERAEIVSKLRADGHLRDYEARFRTKTGEIGYTILSIEIIELAGETCILGVSFDITARKNAEALLRQRAAEITALNTELEQRVAARTAELEVAMEKAQAADRLKSAFLATMSHELRTPLNSIIGFTGILLQGLAGPLNAEQTKQLGMVQSSSRHLLDLINDVLDISKIEAGQLEIATAPFEVPALLDKVVQSVKPLAAKKQLELAVELAPEVGRITGDRRRVEQILLNLLNNAIKFTEHGEVRVECRIRDGQLVTRVRDSGIGIRPEDQGQLFQAFRQIESGLTRRHEGTGLGLAICKRLVEMLGGRIWVESEWGAGSVFTFTLPLEATNQHEADHSRHRGQ